MYCLCVCVVNVHIGKKYILLCNAVYEWMDLVRDTVQSKVGEKINKNKVEITSERQCSMSKAAAAASAAYVVHRCCSVPTHRHSFVRFSSINTKIADIQLIYETQTWNEICAVSKTNTCRRARVHSMLMTTLWHLALRIATEIERNERRSSKRKWIASTSASPVCMAVVLPAQLCNNSTHGQMVRFCLSVSRHPSSPPPNSLASPSSRPAETFTAKLLATWCRI